MTKLKLTIILYGITIVSLFLYSFTQIDLSLTFSRIELLRNIVTGFQHVGYFDRPLSAGIYVSIVTALTIFYVVFLKFAQSGKMSKNLVWKIILPASALLMFSYNAFSYDLFNYVFDAKILTHYHMNPYLYKALDFPADPMLSFMRWTHRTYPYGPVWLVLTAPLSFLGFNFFLPTVFLIKALIGISFLGSIHFIGKIFQKLNPKKEVLGMIFFGLNPLILIESLVSAHLDMVMIFFALWAIYLLVNKKYILSLLLLAISIGIKFATVVLLPVFIYIIVRSIYKKGTNWNFTLKSFIILSVISVFLAAQYSGSFQPWYLVFPISFATLYLHKYYVFIPVVVTSFLMLFTYVPYLFLGNWDDPVLQILNNIYIACVVVSLVGVVGYRLVKKSK